MNGIMPMRHCEFVVMPLHCARCFETAVENRYHVRSLTYLPSEQRTHSICSLACSFCRSLPFSVLGVLHRKGDGAPLCESSPPFDPNRTEFSPSSILSWLLLLLLLPSPMAAYVAVGISTFEAFPATADYTACCCVPMRNGTEFSN